MCNKCGGTNYENQSKQICVQNVIDGLGSGGGSIYLRTMGIPSGITYGSQILIIEDYQGKIKMYSNNAMVDAIGVNLKGTATITAGTTSVVVNHSLGTTPRVFLQPKSFEAADKRFWPSGESSTQFTINIDSADPFNDLTYSWEVKP